MSFRIKNRGYSIVYEPLAVAQHVNPGVSFRKGHFFYDGQLMRLYFYLKHSHPASWQAWGQWVLLEWKLLFKEFHEILYGFYNAARKRELHRWSDLIRRSFNAITARLVVPWLSWRVRQRRKQEAWAGVGNV